ncbi:MAG TPA: imidazole glycerol phosphate synthase subunit HisH [Vicinamibacterales bacterium]|nr:imidazole glycerol phosphate synthase subunit HisH [Vicinamibacterales bacterium]
MEVLVLDYGAGNLTSVMKALRAVGASPVTGAGADAVTRASAIVIPGVGHFAQTASIDDRARDAIGTAIACGVPLLGICLGLQWLFDGSDEAADVAGLGVFPGRCFSLPRRSNDGSTPLKVPHVGWNTLDALRPSQLVNGIPPASFAYFTHTYAAPVVDDTVAVTTHGATFTAVVERGTVFGAQFHPEKSGDAGLRLLANFVRIAGGAC